jgi:hypothetical protein
MNPIEQMATALRERAAGRKRVPITAVWEAFRSAVRGFTGNADARPQLAALLSELQQAGVVVSPRSRRLWDTQIEPALPRWVELVDAARSSRSVDHRTIAWPPALAFVSALRRVGNVDELLAIRRFLAAGGADRPVVPVRERSVELFGDEKRLGALARTGLFGPGRLSLDLLRCFEVAPPLVWEPGPAGASDAVLVIENLHTYDSFRRWNAQAAAYRAVVYGQGTEFVATVRDIPRLVAPWAVTAVEYFGDVDASGLQIAHQAAGWLTAHRIALVPAETWYEILLDRAELLHLPGGVAGPSAPFFAWLPSDLRGRAVSLLQAGHRAPQELVGWQVLSQLLRVERSGA